MSDLEVSSAGEAFIEKNRQAIIQEIATNLNHLYSALTESLSEAMVESKKPIPPAVTESLIDLSTILGNTMSLYNQLIIFEKYQSGEMDEEEKESARPIGFMALHNKEKQ